MTDVERIRKEWGGDEGFHEYNESQIRQVAEDLHNDFHILLAAYDDVKKERERLSEIYEDDALKSANAALRKEVERLKVEGATWCQYGELNTALRKENEELREKYQKALDSILDKRAIISEAVEVVENETRHTSSRRIAALIEKMKEVT